MFLGSNFFFLCHFNFWNCYRVCQSWELGSGICVLPFYGCSLKSQKTHSQLILKRKLKAFKNNNKNKTRPLSFWQSPHLIPFKTWLAFGTFLHNVPSSSGWVSSMARGVSTYLSHHPWEPRTPDAGRIKRPVVQTSLSKIPKGSQFYTYCLVCFQNHKCEYGNKGPLCWAAEQQQSQGPVPVFAEVLMSLGTQGRAIPWAIEKRQSYASLFKVPQRLVPENVALEYSRPYRENSSGCSRIKGDLGKTFHEGLEPSSDHWLQNAYHRRKTRKSFLLQLLEFRNQRTSAGGPYWPETQSMCLLTVHECMPSNLTQVPSRGQALCWGWGSNHDPTTFTELLAWEKQKGHVIAVGVRNTKHR